MSKRSKPIDPIHGQLNAFIEAYRLVTISEHVTKGDAGTIYEQRQALLRAAIITICASFETFLELATETALDFLIKYAANSEIIPQNIKMRISKRLNSSKDERDIWKISDDKWKNELLMNYKLLKSKFNTPRLNNIDEFLFDTLGIKNISNNWKWKGNSVNTSSKKLNHFMDLRGQIAHKVFASTDIQQNTISRYVSFIYRISTISSNVIREHIFKLIKHYPFDLEKKEKIF